jgi:hypothetical protein
MLNAFSNFMTSYIYSATFAYSSILLSQALTNAQAEKLFCSRNGPSGCSAEASAGGLEA